jgi:glucan phosphorylase
MPRRNPLDRFNCGPIKFSGGSDALYERHLTFDHVVPVAAATPRDKFEAIARSVRDLLSQRWIKTEQTYQARNAKRVYYVSLEFLMGRSLANNITNLLLDPVWSQLCKKHQIDPLEILEQEPDAGLGNGGLGRLAACFLDSMATLGIPGIGSGLRYEYGIFKQTVRDGWQHEQPDHWLARTDPWEVPRPDEAVQVHLACSSRFTQERCGPSKAGHRHSSAFRTTARSSDTAQKHRRDGEDSDLFRWQYRRPHGRSCAHCAKAGHELRGPRLPTSVRTEADPLH